MGENQKPVPLGKVLRSNPYTVLYVAAGLEDSQFLAILR